MTMFMNTFGVEAKEILLFLNHVSKITLSKIVDDQLKEVFFLFQCTFQTKI